MSWDVDRGEVVEAVAKNNVEWLWSVIEDAYRERDEARASLSFTQLRAANVQRCEAVFHPIDDWSETDWACAMGGESGEALNKVKKRRRGEEVSVEEVADEVADMIIYGDLLAQRMGFDLGEAVRRKFNIVSDRKDSGIKL